MSEDKYIRSYATHEEYSLFKENLFNHREFFCDLLKSTNELDISKSPSTYGMKYRDLVQHAVDGDVVAARLITSMVYNGDYFTQNKFKAKELMNNLAFGVEGRVDPNSAYHYSRILLKEGEFKHCIQILEDLMGVDFLPAFALTGNLHEYGSGFPKNNFEAEKYYIIASKGGHLSAKFLRGKMHFRQSNIFSKLKGIAMLFGAIFWALYVYTLGKKTPDLRLTY